MTDCFRRLAAFPAHWWLPALDQLLSDPALWYFHTERQDHPASPHKDTKCIYLRGPEQFTVRHIFGVSVKDYLHEQFAMPEMVTLYRYIAYWLETNKAATLLGRVMIANLKPGGRITPHSDQGQYAEYFDRVHFCLSADSPGNYFHCGGETVEMAPGELWWFDHHQEHSVENLTTKDRIHLIMDYR